ncbi:MAG: AAA family ATPase [Epsilonproteobacteria bacterium]|nr:AAA family ATPase [Campylobacterota bacterium]
MRENLSFKEVALEFEKGLIVFTGPSGAGKSVLMNSLLALFGFKVAEAKLTEAVCDFKLDGERFGIEIEDEVIVRAVKKEKVRYFLGQQSVPRKLLKKLFSPYIHYLHSKEKELLESKRLLEIIDSYISLPELRKLRAKYGNIFKKWKSGKIALQELLKKEKELTERKEFLKFEIERITSVAPKIGEYEELMQLKKELSKKEKIASHILEAEEIFKFEEAVIQTLNLLEVDSNFFDETMNRLRELFYSERMKLQELEEFDPKEVLERIEQLATLKRRYGSIESALEALKIKEKELEKLENLEREKERLEEEVFKMEAQLNSLAYELHLARKKVVKEVEEKINQYLVELHLPKITLTLATTPLGESGIDRAELYLNNATVKEMSSGELNRLKLSILAASKKEGLGVLILDEIDANVSGKEAMAVAKILKKLSKQYQVFAISHQAQLASLANQHFLITKENNLSIAKELNYNERIAEIARIISGERVSQEAILYAKQLLKEAS